MAKTWDEFTSRFLAEMPRCPAMTAERAVLDAAIEFCKRTYVYVIDHAAIDAVAGQAEYAWNPGAGLKVVRPEKIWYNELGIDPVGSDDLSELYTYWPSETATPKYYLQEKVESLLLVPKPDTSATGAIKAKVSVRPDLTATGIDDALFDKYVTEINFGARAILFAMAKTDWYDTNLAGYNSRRFEAAIGSVAALTARQHTRAPLRVRTIHGID